MLCAIPMFQYVISDMQHVIICYKSTHGRLIAPAEIEGLGRVMDVNLQIKRVV